MKSCTLKSEIRGQSKSGDSMRFFCVLASGRLSIAFGVKHRIKKRTVLPSHPSLMVVFFDH